MEIIKKAFTHGGKFHADDVFSGALLRILYPEIQIIRGFEVPEDFEGIVFDIGHGVYDHHQQDRRVRENGIPYAAFGLLWERFGEELIGMEAAKKLDVRFIQDMDLADNTGCYHALSDLISSYNPSWDSEKAADVCYEEALTVAKSLLEHKIESSKGIARAEVEVKGALENNIPPILVLNRFAPWKNWVIETEYKFVIYPSKRGGYNVQGVPLSDDTQELKCPLPQSWRGLINEELEAVSGIKGLTFCHNSGFLAAGDSIECLKEACEKALKEFEKEEND
jgi:uncharacterized UPF0160 family protein